MIWVTWRQQRLESFLTACALAAVAAILIPIGLHMASVYNHDHLAACVAHASDCGGSLSAFTSRFEHDAIVPWLNVLPGLFGILFAAPLVLELEHGTFRLAWTQSISRRRWLTIKLATICVSGVVAAFALSALMTWWRQPLDHIEGRMDVNVFDFEGIVPYAYVLFAVALAIAIGVFTRRTVVAMAGALLGYFALRISIQTWLRAHYLAPLREVWRPGAAGPAHLDTAWKLQTGPSDAQGHTVPNAFAIVHQCFGRPKVEIGRCLSAHHLYNIAVYQPASRFWIFQGIEAGIFVGLALVLGAAALWWLSHRLS